MAGFDELKGLSARIKENARLKAEALAREQAERQRIARGTEQFLDEMHRTGVKRLGGQEAPQGGSRNDVDFAAAMRMAGVKPMQASGRAVRRKAGPEAALRAPGPEDEREQPAMSDEAEASDFIVSDDGTMWRREEVGPDVVRDLKRGRWPVLAQLDMHGMFVEEAREKFLDFMINARVNGRSVVRIVHGKGNGSPMNRPVLKTLVRRWLAQHDAVAAFAEPPECAGGAGATVVRLRPLAR